MNLARNMRIIGSCSAILCHLLATYLMADQNSRLLLDDARARLVRIELRENAQYQLTCSSACGTVWISLDSGVFVEALDGNARPTAVGEAHAITAGQIVTFRGRQPSGGRLIVLVPHAIHQPLTVLSQTLSPGSEQDDASSRNETLIVAVTPVGLRDTWNIGDESSWIPSAPRIINLRPEQASWLPPGTHHLRNVLKAPSQFVTVEW